MTFTFRNLLSSVFFLLLSFPLFYFTYKYANPEPLAHDFFQYYRLYKDMDIANVNAPFNMRLMGSFLVHLLYKTGLGYETATAFDYWTQFGFEKRVFFCAVFFNYLCVAATATVIYQTVKRSTRNEVLSVCAGLVSLLSFGTLFYGLMPLTDAFSMLLFAVALSFYLKKHWGVFVILTVAVLQREYILIAFALISLVDFVSSRQRYYLFVFLAGIVLFGVFFLLRRTVFYTHALAFQTSLSDLWRSFIQPDFRPLEFFRQLALTLNVFFLYIGLLAYKKFCGMPVNRKWFAILILLLVQLVLLSFAARLGNNVGRYFYIASPLMIYFLAIEARDVFQKQSPDLRTKLE